MQPPRPDRRFAARPAFQVGLAALSGVLHVLALPPLDLGWLAFGALVPLLVVLRVELRPRRRALASGVFGLISVLGVIHWLPGALIEGNGFAPLHAAVVSTGVFAYYTAWFVVWPLGLAWLARGPIAWPLAAPLSFGAMEALRDGAAPALAWTVYGHTQHEVLPMLQLAEWVGAAGLSMLLVAINASVAEACVQGWRAAGVGRWARPLGVAVATSVVALGVGASRLATVEEERRAAGGGGVSVAAVQVAVPQAERWQPEQAWPRIEALLDLTRAAARAGATLIVWPETSVELHLDKAPGLGPAVAEALSGRPDARVLAGVPREVRDDGRSRFFNSAVLIDATGAARDLYDKVRLYPVSEYVPGWLLALPFASRLLESQLRWEPYSPGRASHTVIDGSVPLGVLICAEGIAPDLARARARAGAELLVHLANDAVVPGAAAAAQHFAITRLRAVETRRPLVRASNLGVTAVVAASGRVLARAPFDEPGVALAEVVPRTVTTGYVLGGWLLPWLCVAATVVGGALPRRDPHDRAGQRDVANPGRDV